MSIYKLDVFEMLFATLQVNFICNVQVKSVEENDSWWYGSCSKNSCHEEVIKFEGKYRCMRCNKNYPVPQKRSSE